MSERRGRYQPPIDRASTAPVLLIADAVVDLESSDGRGRPDR